MFTNVAEFWNRIGWKLAYGAIVVIWFVMMAAIFS